MTPDSLTTIPLPDRTTAVDGTFRLPPLALVEHLARDCGVAFDRGQARAALRETATSEQGSASATAMLRALGQVGMMGRQRFLTIAETMDAAREGAILAAPAAEGDGTWLLVRGAGLTRVRLARQRGADAWLSRDELAKLVGTASEEQTNGWIVAEAALPCSEASRGTSARADAPHSHHAPHGHGHMKPLARLMALLRPEWSDIWIVTVFSAIVSVLALATPITVEALVNTVAFGRLTQPVVILSLILLGCLGFAAVLRVFQTYIAEVIQRRIFVRVVADLSHRLPRARFDALDGAHGPELLNRFFDVMTVQKSAALLVLDGIRLILQVAVGMAVLALYHPLLAGFDIALLAALAFIVFVLGRGAVRTSIEESKAKYAVAAWLELLGHCPIAFKSAGGPERAAEHADRLAVEYLHAREQHFRVLLRQIMFTLGLQALAGSVLLGIGGWLVLQGQLTLGQLVAAELIVTLIVGSLAKLGKHLESFYDLLAAVDKLGHLFDIPVESPQGESLPPDPQPAALRVIDFPVGRGHGRRISFDIQPGEMVALVGPPGSGKSRLLEGLFGLRPAQGGTVELDGVEVRAISPSSLREQVALARGLELFTGSVAENIHLNRDDVKRSHVRTALQEVGLYDELKALPEGLDTLVLPSAAPLTECQARRVVLARALVGRPRLLLVSELLDGLPDDVLADLLVSLQRVSAHTTVVIATGRHDVAQACRRVIPLAPSRAIPSEHGPATDLSTHRHSA